MLKTSLDHLPASKREEIQLAAQIVYEEIESKARPETLAEKRKGRVYKVILFGSYARGTWVDEKNTGKGYQSDYDLLVVVSNKELTDGQRYWWAAEDRILHEPRIKTPVSIIVHSLAEVNSELKQGHYFFRDAVEQGIALYEFVGGKSSGNRKHNFVQPGNLTAAEAYAAAKRHFEMFYPKSLRRIKAFRFEISESNQEADWLADAAFTLHQAAEFAYKAVLLTLTLYTPPGHNLNRLRGLVEDKDERLIAAWPRGRAPYDGYFQDLRRSYTDSRYSAHYSITREELEWLAERVEVLQKLAGEVCGERLEALKRAVEEV